jgi:protein-S-isoprenylcysteine O-methyltransferase Ste14
MMHFSLAANPMPIVLFWVNFCAWVAIWIGLVLRDRGVDVHTPADQGSRVLIGISLWSGVVCAFLVAWAVPAAWIPGNGWSVLLSGLAMMWGGIALRVWAVRTLGRFFRTVVMIHANHRLITTGPYRLIRHPSYAGSLLTLAGLGLALGSWLSLLVAVLGALIGFTRRIRIEESALRARFGDAYTAYTRRTWRLAPLIWSCIAGLVAC